MVILGLSFDYHDAAAALVKDGVVLAAAQEERFSRVKNDKRFPKNAVSFCLRKAGISAKQLDRVVYYENAMVKFDRIVKASVSGFPKSKNYFKNTMRSWAIKRKFMIAPRIVETLEVPFWKIRSVEHHQAHAGAAFFCSPFKEATIVTLDGVGEYETLSVSVGRGRKIRRLQSLSLPHSLGLFYSAFTAFLGFEVNEGEYKVMGMSAFGKPLYYDKMRELFTLLEDGTFRLKQEPFNFLWPETLPYTEALIRDFGPAREPESEFRIGKDIANDPVASRSKYYADIAASVQKCTEEVVLHVVSKAVERTGISDVCMAGGVALNSLANGRIKSELGHALYVHPAAGDAGSAIGAAQFYEKKTLRRPRRVPLENPFLGEAHDEAAIAKAVKNSFNENVKQFDSEEALLKETARLLSDGAVVGWVQGPFEWGPRALGGRSILANPMRQDMQRIVNEKIKFREPFRPFAPAVTEDRAPEFFDFPPVRSLSDPEYFMLAICRVKEEKRPLLPAVTHADGTARLQLVHRETNGIFYRLIDAFGKITGVPVLLNTSFNLRGEPMVNTPEDALKTFEWCDMDYLVIGKHLVKKT